MTNSNYNTNIQKAIAFATAAHDGQFRKYLDNVPYVVHPIAVMELVSTVPHTEAMLIAAILHDTVEDTQITPANIKDTFGDHVASLVEMLTDVSKPEDGNRTVRKAIDLEHTAKASPEAKTIKLADLINNTTSIIEHDPKFAKVYLAEKEKMLGFLKGGDETLHAIATTKLNAGKLILDM